jgi:hypothetical protein
MTVHSMAKFDLEQLPHLWPQQHNAKPTQYPLHLTRAVMRGLATTGLCCTLIIMIIAGVMSGWNLLIWDFPVVRCRKHNVERSMLLTISQIAVCIIYNSSDLITARVNKKGFHPAVSVAADLTMSVVLLLVGAIELIRDSSGYATYEQFITAGGAVVVVVG